MPKFFVSAENITDTHIKIKGEDVAHIKRVLRMKAGEQLDLCDSLGFDYDAVIEEISDKEILCAILKKEKSETGRSVG